MDARALATLLLLLLLPAGTAVLSAPALAAGAGETEAPKPRTVVEAEVQTRPGAEPVRTEMPVFEVPVDPPSVPADEAPLSAEDLVLGVVVDGEPRAYPIRWVAEHEVIDDRVGEVPLAATW